MSGPTILLGITGGIAAYKTPELIRRLRDRGADVQVVLTEGARHFVTETTLQAVSGHPVRSNLWDTDAEASMGHIELARWADQIIIAPATAEFLSRLAAGGAPDLLATLCLATEAPVTVAPAMNHVMWSNPAVQANVQTIAERGIRILGPAEGDQACGETGPGRMVEPDAIVTELIDRAATGPLAGKTVLITAGPTREAIDPVRYISNRSSGKMGYAIAAAARDAGADVILLSGPVSLDAPPGVQRVLIESAQDLHEATQERVGNTDVFIGVAAVADYRPQEAAKQKIKKSSDKKSVEKMSIDMIRTPDVLASVAALGDPPFTVGFAAETDRVKEYALAKLAAKDLDMIVANQVGGGRAFGQDDNTLQVFWRGGEQMFPKASKHELARDLIRLIGERYRSSRSSNVTELPTAAN